MGPTLEVAAEVAREAGAQVRRTFGWERTTLARMAAALAAPELAARGLVPSGRLTLEALSTRVVHRLAEKGELGRFAAVADRPGLPRALARTFNELRMAKTEPRALGETDLQRLCDAFAAELEADRIADRALIFELAVTAALDRTTSHPFLDVPMLLVDLPLRSVLETELLTALALRAEQVLATFPEGDQRTEQHLGEALAVRAVRLTDPSRTTLSRLQRGLFSPTTETGEVDDAVEMLSAPGESRECIEIARRILREAARGVPFDRMAIVLRAPVAYRAHLVEALRRAAIPAYFARGTVRPDSAGRAFLALLWCAIEKLSARRFSEYLSLSEVPGADEGGRPPPPLAGTERWVVPDDEFLPSALERTAEDEPQEEEAAVVSHSPSSLAVVGGTLRAPYRWERLIVDAAVIGGRKRWESRLGGRAKSLERELGLYPEDNARAVVIRRELADLASLQSYALPLLDDLAALPPSADWGTYIDRLGALATRALRRPNRVLSVLAELEPLRRVGPVSLSEVRLVLEQRLTELTVPPRGRRFGCVYIASTEEVRGLTFEVVFVPGLAERIFPQKVIDDPVLPDRVRLAHPLDLVTNRERSEEERLALRIAAGAANARLVLSYPRIDVEQSRPRTPSFYGLEVLRAAEGRLPGFDELARRAERVGDARIGWPAPAQARDAVDAAEHDLSLLESILKKPEAETIGTARYLLSTNPHLARALRTRARRWHPNWFSVDGLLDVKGEAREALDAHLLSRRSFSPTALQNFAACPYRFVLQAIHRLGPRDEPAPIEELDPLERGSLVHDVEYTLYVRLRDKNMLPVTRENRRAVEAELDQALAEVAARYQDDLAPAIDRVWQDGIEAIAADLREMLRRDAEDDEWSPTHFELSFGLPDRAGRDPASIEEPLKLDEGILLRGSIDCVERSARGTLRATDYKTGKVRATATTRIGGGQTLQPIFYALALEKLFEGRSVEGGRLYYCTTAGEFKEYTIGLDEAARAEAKTVVNVVGKALEAGALPAAPDEGACQYCDYLRVCGPYEEMRTRKVKNQAPLAPLMALRRRA
ncbi:PD-(D/E)XK nuclease family protein [Pendulispora albinea]|uniref:PD-(D/E)XK nuclease family protein n=1 Tax=Pendulispora albinea TaxID=2741071 RepID=A0ABZ2M8N4_9BACT